MVKKLTRAQYKNAKLLILRCPRPASGELETARIMIRQRRKPGYLRPSGFLHYLGASQIHGCCIHLIRLDHHPEELAETYMLLQTPRTPYKDYKDLHWV